ncbi:MAG: neuraminidase-like domain-containing protein [Myxococcota bacterium]
MPPIAVVRGTVVREGTSPPQRLAARLIQLGSVRGTRFARLAETRTDPDGGFTFDLTALGLSRSVDLEIRVLEHGQRLRAHGDVRWRSTVDPGPLVICVEPDESCAGPTERIPDGLPGKNTVWGRVRHLDGTPLGGVRVDVRQISLRDEIVIASVLTSPDGWYGAVADPTDLVVRVLEVETPAGPGRLLGSSLAVYEPTFPLRVDIDVADEAYRQASEWSRIGRALARALGDTAPADLDVRRIAMLSGRTRWDVERLTTFALAHRLGRQIGADPEAVYGLLRLGFPRSIEALVAKPRQTVRPALIAAGRANLVSHAVHAPRAVDRLHQAFARALTGAMSGPRSDTLGEILRASPTLSPAAVDRIVDRYATHTGSEASFWDDLGELGPESVSEARRLVALGTLGLAFAPIVRSIVSRLGTQPASAVASWSTEDWAALTRELPTLPEGLPGETVAERRQVLAGWLAEHAERMFPSKAARSGLVRLLPDSHPASRFLIRHPAFDLARSRVADFTGSPEEQAAATQLQRLYRIAPDVGRAEASAALVEAGFSSAWSIARVGRSRFVAAHGAVLGVEQARLIADKAATMQALTTTFLMQAHPTVSRPPFQFLPASASAPTLPEWDQLFGNAGGCACDWCRSVHGPAAYLVDLLQWLEARPVHGHPRKTLYDELVARRPDLVAIELSCENAERALPYVDLVLEALESAVVTGVGVGADAAHDTVVTTPDLLASPQYRNDAAYAKLRASTLAPTLPFHRALAEQRAFLRHLGAPRIDLLRAFASVPPAALATEELLAFGGQIAAIKAPTGSELAYWAVGSLADLARVATLRRAAALTWSDVLDLLHSRTANPRTSGGPRLVVTATDPCDVDTATLALAGGGAPEEADWTRIRQFVRLWRTTGWTMLDLDKVLVALGVSDLANDEWVGALAAVVRLATEEGVAPVSVAMTLATTLDTWLDRDTRPEPTPSLFDATFRSPGLLVAGDPDYPFFELNADRSELGYLDTQPVTTIEAHAGSVSAALGLAREQLDAVRARLPDDALTLANLTRVYQWVVVARIAALDPIDLLGLVDLTGAAPLGDLDAVVSLRDAARELAEFGWSVDAARYVVAGEPALGPSDDRIRGVLGGLRDALRARFASLGSGVTEASVREEVERILSEGLGLDPDALASVRGLGWSALPPLAESAFVAAEALTVTVGPTAVALTGGVRCVVPTGTSVQRDGVAVVLDVDTITLLTADVVGSVTEVVAPQGAPWTRTATGEAVVQAGSSLGIGLTALPANTRLTGDGGGSLVLTNETPVRLDPPMAWLAPTEIRGAPRFASAPPEPDLLQRFLRTTFREEGVGGDQPYDDVVDEAGGTYEDDFSIARALAKLALILGHLRLDAEERTFWIGEGAGWALAPADGVADGAATFGFDALQRLIRLFGQRARLPGVEPSFVGVLESVAAGSFAETAAARTGWPASDLATVAGQAGADPATVDGLKALLDRMWLVVRCGADAVTVTGWATAPEAVTSEASAQVVAAARAKVGSPDAWAGVARPVRDELRTAQRDALVAWLLAHAVHSGDAALATPDDLYQRYLIDVSMNPELLTSRIVQATASVQLFVHRLLLGLELDPKTGRPLFEAYPEDRAQWEWMRTYRVWEAARKVFLYPEDWIEPELRDDKSPFFRDLERELGQGEANAQRVEEAVLDYLDRLREVANLQVLGLFWQQEAEEGADPVDRLHVIARTRGEPASYWYRRREDGARWTPWEPVQCGVEGDSVALVVQDGRLLLFWCTVGDAASGDGTGQEARLSWSEVRDRQWAPKRMSDGVPIALTDSVRGLMIVLDRTDDGTISIRLTEKSNYKERGDLDEGFVRARFILDPGTLALTGTAVDGEADDRAAVEGAFWSAPGYSARDPEIGLWIADWLTVYDAEVEGGEVAPGAVRSAVPLLGELAWFTVVVPASVSGDFVGQAPFFVQTDQRVWLVEEVEGWGGPTGVAEGTIGSLSSLRRGTLAPTAAERVGVARSSSYTDYLSSDLYDSVQGAAALEVAEHQLAETAAPSWFDLSGTAYRFSNFYHPHARAFTAAVRRGGVSALLDPDPAGPDGVLRRQQIVGDFDFASLAPDPDHVSADWPVEDVDFDERAAFSGYNWELFYHLPLFVASRLMDEGRHDDAMTWLHAIFDPRVPASDVPPGGDPSARWWKVAPLMEVVSAPVTDWLAFTAETAGHASFTDQVEAWRDDPFDPHLLARLRPGTYQKVTVMRYLDNLIAWGDQLFARDTLESLTEATQLYVLALQILGDRPETVAPAAAIPAKTYAELRAEGAFDAFGNVVLENAFTPEVVSSGAGSAGAELTVGAALPYFCVPINARLLSYWDTVADRLFKIRNGLNLDGVARSLALFQPPIDPAALVRAAAAGMDLGTALDGLDLPLPSQRFASVHGRALALASSVRALAGALLSAMEKRDAEALATLRTEHEGALLARVEQVRSQQVADAAQSIAALRASKDQVLARKAYYDRLIDRGWNAHELHATELARSGDRSQNRSAALATLGSALGAIPDFYTTLPPSVKVGGVMLSRVALASSEYFAFLAAQDHGKGGRLTVRAGYQRRAQEWKNQSQLAGKELVQLDRQIEGAELRLGIARTELANHQLQMRQSDQVSAFMSRKFTNGDLYQWMVGQLAALHFQQFQLALGLAKKAQAAYRFELGGSDTFVSGPYWDGLRKGLGAGERLVADLERMDAAYLENDRREFELRTAVSLARLDPMALARLRQVGECWLEVPEALFDLECPGHVFRRLVSVAVTVACVAGPHGLVQLRLTQHGSKIRRSATGALEDQPSTYPSIVTSSGSEDAGVFDASGPRYLPFERTGAVSTWHLAFANQTLAQLDWDSVADVVLHLRYTARDGGEAYRAAIAAGLPAALDALRGGFTDLGMTATVSGSAVGISARRDDPDAWFQAQDGGGSSLTLGLVDRLPYFAAGRVDGVTGVQLAVVGGAPVGATLSLDGVPVALAFASSDGLSIAAAELSGVSSWPASVSVTFDSGVAVASLDDVVLILAFSVSE